MKGVLWCKEQEPPLNFCHAGCYQNVWHIRKETIKTENFYGFQISFRFVEKTESAWKKLMLDSPVYAYSM
jgi:hypothetical protein